MFISAGELKRVFYTEGAFYELDVDGTGYECRGLARIVRKGREADKADALIVMMNPGSCRPADEAYTYPPAGDLFDIPMVRAKEDQTQYQLMRLMEMMQWDLVYIINLSDLASGNSNEFLSLKRKVLTSGRTDHSIFNETRIESIQTLLIASKRLIVAWGKNSKIKKEALQAHAILSSMAKVEGLSDGHPFYCHPFPMLKSKCVEWLEDMEGELRKDTILGTV